MSFSKKKAVELLEERFNNLKVETVEFGSTWVRDDLKLVEIYYTGEKEYTPGKFVPVDSMIMIKTTEVEINDLFVTRLENMIEFHEKEIKEFEAMNAPEITDSVIFGSKKAISALKYAIDMYKLTGGIL